MQNATVECPHCLSQLAVPVSLDGSQAECPFCKKSFLVNLDRLSGGKIQAAPSPRPAANPGRKTEIVSIVISVLAMLISVAMLVFVLLSSGASSLSSFGVPQLKFSKDASTAVKNQVAFQIELRGISDYFWKKNGKKILNSLEIKEIKTNGNWAVVFYKLSHGATEVKDAGFLYKTEDGYWVRVSYYNAKKKCPSEWYNDMKNRIERFTKDSGRFDELDDI